MDCECIGQLWQVLACHLAVAWNLFAKIETIILKVANSFWLVYQYFTILYFAPTILTAEQVLP